MKNRLLKLAKDKRGAAVLVAVIIIAAVIFVISITLGVSSISENQISLYQSQSNRLLFNADGCTEEALIQLNRNNGYMGETLSLDNTSCTIGISGNGNNRTITVTAVNTNYTKFLEIDVNIFPTFAISSWQELTN